MIYNLILLSYLSPTILHRISILITLLTNNQRGFSTYLRQLQLSDEKKRESELRCFDHVHTWVAYALVKKKSKLIQVEQSKKG